jgi:hypothetical protein
MAVFTILAPKAREGEVLPDPMTLVFVKDGFNWPALFFAAPWLLYRRMWLTLVVYIIVAMGATWLAAQITEGFSTFVGIAIQFLFALEANHLRVRSLERRGYRMIAVSEGRNLEEAEIRFFSEAEVAALPQPPAPPAPPSVPRVPQPPVKPSAEAGDVVGLFPAPGAPA